MKEIIRTSHEESMNFSGSRSAISRKKPSIQKVPRKNSSESEEHLTEKKATIRGEYQTFKPEKKRESMNLVKTLVESRLGAKITMGQLFGILKDFRKDDFNKVLIPILQRLGKDSNNINLLRQWRKKIKNWAVSKKVLPCSEIPQNARQKRVSPKKLIFEDSCKTDLAPVFEDFLEQDLSLQSPPTQRRLVFLTNEFEEKEKFYGFEFAKNYNENNYQEKGTWSCETDVSEAMKDLNFDLTPFYCDFDPKCLNFEDDS